LSDACRISRKFLVGRLLFIAKPHSLSAYSPLEPFVVEFRVSLSLSVRLRWYPSAIASLSFFEQLIPILKLLSVCRIANVGGTFFTSYSC
jgi:hypothetical protein